MITSAGQGMTSAAMQAAALDELLLLRMGRLEGLAPAFFKRAAQVIDTPWQLAVGEDFRFPETTGPKPAGVDLLNRYVAAVHRATLVDPVVGAAFIKVMNLLASPSSLLTPGIMLRVLRANWGHSRAVSELRSKRNRSQTGHNIQSV